MPLKDREKRNEYQKKWKLDHPDYYKKMMKEYYLNHKSEIKAYRLKNKDKIALNHKIWHAKNRTSILKKKRNRNLIKSYGISELSYKYLQEMQGNRCAICGKESNLGGPGNRLQVDHCHDTNMVRGLLCGDCNLGLGKFHDNIDSMLKAVSYLQEFYRGIKNAGKRNAA